MRQLLHNLYNNNTNLNFVGMWKRMAVFSLVLVLISVVALTTRGLNLGIEFEGGVVWEVRAPEASTADTRDALSGVGLADAKIQIIGDDVVRVRAELDEDNAQAIDDASNVLAELADVDLSEVSVSTISPSWGSEITDRAVRALIVFFVLVAIYIWIRLEWKMAVAALVAVAHDILVSVGVYALFQFDVTPATAIAFLTIMGYSLYDTLVVFDKIKANNAKLSAKLSYTEVVNQSMNNVLMRSVNTSITSMLPVLAMLAIGSGVLGAVALQEFALALFIGILLGTYSSIFVAAPLVTWLKEREPDARAVTEQQVRTTKPAGVATRARGAKSATSVASGRSGGTAGAVPPRPRKKRKR